MNHNLIITITALMLSHFAVSQNTWEFLEISADHDTLHRAENYRFTAKFHYTGSDTLTQDSAHTFRWTVKGSGFPANYSFQLSPGDTAVLESPEFRFEQGDEVEICTSKQLNDSAEEKGCRTFPLIAPVSAPVHTTSTPDLKINRSGNVFSLNNKQNCNWTLFDLSGRVVINRKTTELSVPQNQYSGIFILRAQTPSRQVITEKIHLR